MISQPRRQIVIEAGWSRHQSYAGAFVLLMRSARMPFGQIHPLELDIAAFLVHLGLR